MRPRKISGYNAILRNPCLKEAEGNIVNRELNLEALWSLSYGLYIVTSHREGKFNGQIANTVFQVTAKPPRIATSINKDNLTNGYISDSGVFAVSVLDESTPMTLIGLFGFKSGKDVDKLSQVSFRKGITGCPLVTENALSILEAKVISQVDVGTHILFIGDIVSAEVLRQGRPLTYAHYQQIKRGKTPKNSPTYRQPTQSGEIKRAEKHVNQYRCSVCGYIYDPAVGDPEHGIDPGTPFEDLPDDWVCPVCGSSKDQFKPES